jgi:hypothetical protein
VVSTRGCIYKYNLPVMMAAVTYFIAGKSNCPFFAKVTYMTSIPVNLLHPIAHNTTQHPHHTNTHTTPHHNTHTTPHHTTPHHTTPHHTTPHHTTPHHTTPHHTTPHHTTPRQTRHARTYNHDIIINYCIITLHGEYP